MIDVDEVYTLEIRTLSEQEQAEIAKKKRSDKRNRNRLNKINKICQFLEEKENVSVESAVASKKDRIRLEGSTKSVSGVSTRKDQSYLLSKEANVFDTRKANEGHMVLEVAATGRSSKSKHDVPTTEKLRRKSKHRSREEKVDKKSKQRLAAEREDRLDVASKEQASTKTVSKKSESKADLVEQPSNAALKNDAPTFSSAETVDSQAKAETDSSRIQEQVERLTDMTRQEENLTEITRQEENLTEITRQAEDLTDITRQEENLTELTIQEENLTEITRQAENLADITRQEENMTEITRQAENLADITRQEENLTEITRQAEDLTEITRQAENLTEITRPAENLTDITRQAENMSDCSKDIGQKGSEILSQGRFETSNNELDAVGIVDISVESNTATEETQSEKGLMFTDTGKGVFVDNSDFGVFGEDMPRQIDRTAEDGCIISEAVVDNSRQTNIARRDISDVAEEDSYFDISSSSKEEEEETLDVKGRVNESDDEQGTAPIPCCLAGVQNLAGS